jgi:hypothetical protein
MRCRYARWRETGAGAIAGAKGPGAEAAAPGDAAAGTTQQPQAA